MIIDTCSRYILACRGCICIWLVWNLPVGSRCAGMVPHVKDVALIGMMRVRQAPIIKVLEIGIAKELVLLGAAVLGAPASVVTTTTEMGASAAPAAVVAAASATAAVVSSVGTMGFGRVHLQDEMNEIVGIS